AGRAGNFGYVVGVNRLDHAEALSEAGADVVVDDLADLLTEGAGTTLSRPPVAVPGPPADRPDDEPTTGEEAPGATATVSTALGRPATPPSTPSSAAATRSTRGSWCATACPCRTWLPASPCSPSPTGTSGCAAPWRRVSRGWCRAPTSTASTSSGRCRTPRPGTASRSPGRPR